MLVAKWREYNAKKDEYISSERLLGIYSNQKQAEFYRKKARKSFDYNSVLFIKNTNNPITTTAKNIDDYIDMETERVKYD